jgi:hypothetical protein
MCSHLAGPVKDSDSLSLSDAVHCVWMDREGVYRTGALILARSPVCSARITSDFDKSRGVLMGEKKYSEKKYLLSAYFPEVMM